MKAALSSSCLSFSRCESEIFSVVSDSLQPHGLYSWWNSPGQNTGVGSFSLLQGISLSSQGDQGSTPGLLYCRRILYQLNHKGRTVFPLFFHMAISSHFKLCDNSGGLFRRAVASLEGSSCINLKCLVRWYPGDLCVNNKHFNTCLEEALNEREGKYHTSKTLRGLFRFEVPQARTTPNTASHPINITKQLSSMWCAVVGTSQAACTSKMWSRHNGNPWLMDSGSWALIYQLKSLPKVQDGE